MRETIYREKGSKKRELKTIRNTIYIHSILKDVLRNENIMGTVLSVL